ncbi:CCA tRNA nucleotidyltransferase [Microseira wollei]|uniref:Polynucleotide adenylyltransferase region n=1 Tax=Microseira wollei NIES-4236 TaxID=2530354 RepID=A0AAV3X3A7_9CYAN|nr:CCA tRNA nucleotidyltransferase [Microseira wollei]GET36260.1 polynucleotide adenylyltransferase region [Microseira wollei NIES-4236]
MNREDAKDAKEEGKEEGKEGFVLSPEGWPFGLEWLPPSAYMVGGAVRDALLQRRREYLDLDFVMPERAVKTARAIASHYKAGFVLLDRERQIARVVFKDATADFAQQEGDTLETDLNRRDFTINAIAYNPHTQELIDPLQGCADLQSGIIRMVSPQNLQDDPLRLLRGYRQASQLGFVIEPHTRAAMREFAPLLGKIAAERVRVELGYLLGSPQGTPWLLAAWEDGILRWALHDNVTAHNLELVAAVDRASAILAESWPKLAEELASGIPGLAGGKVSWSAIAKLATLILPHPEAEPPLPRPQAEPGSETLPRPQAEPGSETSEAEPRINYSRAGITVENASVEDFFRAIKYSLPEIRGVTTILKCLPQLQISPMSLRQQYFLFREAGVVFPALAVVAVATGISVDKISPLINRYLIPDDQVAHPTPLVGGTDLIKTLNLPAGPKVGWLLTEIQLARIQGKISTPAAAIKLASQLLDTQ